MQAHRDFPLITIDMSERLAKFLRETPAVRNLNLRFQSAFLRLSA
jgi:hypothetical protein